MTSGSLNKDILLASFKRQVGDIYIEPARLYPVKECSDRALATVVEEARLYKEPHSLLTQLDTGDSGELPSPPVAEYENVIVKTYRPNFILTAAELNHLVTECNRIHSLCHPNMVHLLGMGCFNTDSKEDIYASIYLVEEFGGSWSLFKMLRSKKLHRSHPHVQFTPADCMRWLINIADAVAYLHSHGVVHRDLKPENIWLTDADVSECEARIGDLKPHRHNFRKFARGHLRTTSSLEPLSASPTSSRLSQFSLSRHMTASRSALSQISGLGASSMLLAQSDAAGGPVSASGLSASHLEAANHLDSDEIAEERFKSFKVTTSSKVYHHEAAPLLLAQSHPKLDGDSFVAAVNACKEGDVLVEERLSGEEQKQTAAGKLREPEEAAGNLLVAKPKKRVRMAGEAGPDAGTNADAATGSQAAATRPAAATAAASGRDEGAAAGGADAAAMPAALGTAGEADNPLFSGRPQLEALGSPHTSRPVL